MKSQTHFTVFVALSFVSILVSAQDRNYYEPFGYGQKSNIAWETTSTRWPFNMGSPDEVCAAFAAEQGWDINDFSVEVHAHPTHTGIWYCQRYYKGQIDSSNTFLITSMCQLNGRATPVSELPQGYIHSSPKLDTHLGQCYCAGPSFFDPATHYCSLTPACKTSDELVSAGNWVCGQSKNRGLPEQCSGNPINTITGNKFEVENDILFGAWSPLGFSRYYNSSSRVTNWSSSYSRTVSLASVRYGESDFSLLYRRDDGKTQILELQPNSNPRTYTSADTGIVAAENVDPVSGTRRFILRLSDGSVEYYSELGQLVRMRSFDGQVINIEYSNKIRKITDRRGHWLDVIHADERMNYPLRVTSSHGTMLAFTWSDMLPKKLLQVTRTDGDLSATRVYLYEDSRHPTALTGLLDEEGHRFATWVYDADGRAIQSSHADGTEIFKLDFSFAEDAQDPRVIETNPNGKKSVFHFGKINDALRVTSINGLASDHCAAASKERQYSADGAVLGKTDWLGNTTEFQRDKYGREISRTEAAGTPDARTIATEYHPTLNKPVKITEPGKVTTMTYDAEGRLLSNTTQSTVAP